MAGRCRRPQAIRRGLRPYPNPNQRVLLAGALLFGLALLLAQPVGALGRPGTGEILELPGGEAGPVEVHRPLSLQETRAGPAEYTDLVLRAPTYLGPPAARSTTA